MRAALGQRFCDPLASVSGRDPFREVDRMIARPLAARLPTIEPLPKPEPPRDPQKFYWRTPAGHREGASVWVFECARFPHQETPQPFVFVLLAPLPEADALDTTIRFRASASNLRDPLDLTFGLRITIDHEGTVDEIEAALHSAGWPT